MKKLILDKIEELGGNVSFVDLEDLPGFTGDEHLGLPENNLVYWMDVSRAFAKAVHELVRDGVVEFEITSPHTYAIDGRMLSLPLFEDDSKYDSPRWLPVVLNKGPRFDEYRAGRAA